MSKSNSGISTGCVRSATGEATTLGLLGTAFTIFFRTIGFGGADGLGRDKTTMGVFRASAGGASVTARGAESFSTFFLLIVARFVRAADAEAEKTRGARRGAKSEGP